jgi:hypothetical protein
MDPLTCKRFVRAPQHVVFAAASDLRGAPQRIPAILKLDVLTDGPIRAGTRFRETRKMFGREATEEMEVLTLDAPRSYTVGCESHGCRYHTEFRFAARDGGTDVEMEFRAEPLTFFAKAMSILMAPLAKQILKECTKDLDSLAAAIENADTESDSS